MGEALNVVTESFCTFVSIGEITRIAKLGVGSSIDVVDERVARDPTALGWRRVGGARARS